MAYERMILMIDDTDMTVAERRSAWITALRSGEYKQASGALRWMDNTFCCMGVAVDLFGNGWEDSASLYYAMEPDGSAGGGIMPRAVCEKLGLLEHAGPTEASNVMTHLAYLNDEKGYSFEQIADGLENKPHEFFIMEGDDA